MEKVYYEDSESLIRTMKAADDKEFYEAFTAQGWHPEQGNWLKRIQDEADGKVPEKRDWQPAYGCGGKTCRRGCGYCLSGSWSM